MKMNTKIVGFVVRTAKIEGVLPFSFYPPSWAELLALASES